MQAKPAGHPSQICGADAKRLPASYPEPPSAPGWDAGQPCDERGMWYDSGDSSALEMCAAQTYKYTNEFLRSTNVIPLQVHTYGRGRDTHRLLKARRCDSAFRLAPLQGSENGRKKGAGRRAAPRERASILREDDTRGPGPRAQMRGLCATSIHTALIDGARWRMRGADGRYRGLERALDYAPTLTATRARGLLGLGAAGRPSAAWALETWTGDWCSMAAHRRASSSRLTQQRAREIAVCSPCVEYGDDAQRAYERSHAARRPRRQRTLCVRPQARTLSRRNSRGGFERRVARGAGDTSEEG
ncbi:hypothetical protein C8R44DRAFT_895994 [Mycena epipterygia]|nr:hypothetical protein C8R44DRAFT_895994 [Mycena epipterygia]